MPDETTTAVQSVTTEGETSNPVTPEVTPDAEPVVATVVNLLEELDKADPKTLRSHPRIAGMIGSEIQRAREEEHKRIEQEAATRAAREAEEQLLELAKQDPEAFALKWLGERDQKKINDQLSTIKGQTRQELAQSIGKAYNELPEWTELSDKDHEELAKALMNKADDEVLPIFTRKALDIIADKRAAKKFEEYKSKELGKDRESIRQEEAARLLKESESTDTTPPKTTPPRVDVRNMSDAEFVEFWKRL